MSRWLAVGMTLMLLSTAVKTFAVDAPMAGSFDAKGVRIHYLTQGAGEPVVLIHGLHASAATNWKLPGIVDRLAKQQGVIALDLPGHGQSDKPEREEAYGVQMAEDVALLLDHLQIKRAHIVGYSLGGMVALKFITLHPERAISGTLGGMGWLREGSRLQDVWEKLPSREGSRTPAVCVHSVGQLAVTEETLVAIKIPMTVIVGDRDPVKKLYVAPLQNVRKDWPVIEIEGAGHINAILKPQFAEAIEKALIQNHGK